MNRNFPFSNGEDNYTRAVDFRTYRLANCFPKYANTVSSYSTKLVKKMKVHTKGLFLDPKESISIIGFFATSILACDTKNIQKSIAMKVLPCFVKKTLANALNNCMRPKDRQSPFAAFVRNKETSSRKLQLSCLEAANYILQKYATDQWILLNDTCNPRHVQPSNMTPQEPLEDVLDKS